MRQLIILAIGTVLWIVAVTAIVLNIYFEMDDIRQGIILYEDRMLQKYRTLSEGYYELEFD